MDWLKTIAPTAASLLAGPLAGVAVKFLADKVGATAETAEAVTSALTGLAGTPEGRIRLAEIDADLRKHAIDAGIDLERLAVQNAADINKTMQVEAGAEHWPSYSWRPFIGFVFGSYVLSLWVLPLLGKAPVPISSDVVLTVGAILGVASWFRGKAQADPNNSAPVKG
jgi:hypothetical protein